MDTLRVFSNMRKVQETNKTTILRVLYEKAPISRVDLARETRLSSPTVTRIVKELLDHNIVHEVGKVASHQGRSPVLLELNLSKPFIVGVEIGKWRVSGVVSGLKGDVKTSFLADLPSQDVDTVAELLTEKIERAVAGLGFDVKNLLGIGVSISGLVSADQQMIIYSDSMDWRDVPITRLLPTYQDYTIVVENDANSAMLGECWLGRFGEYSNIMFISAGQGIGASIRHDGQLVRGRYGIAGEIGHTLMEEDGLLCTCGQRGCLEAYVTFDALQKQYEAEARRHQPFLKAYLNGDPAARGMADKAAVMLARIIVSSCLLINPEVVILGGLWVEAGEEFLEMVKEAVSDHFVLGEAYLPQIDFASLRLHAGVMGAVGLIIDGFLEYPAVFMP